MFIMFMPNSLSYFATYYKALANAFLAISSISCIHFLFIWWDFLSFLYMILFLLYLIRHPTFFHNNVYSLHFLLTLYPHNSSPVFSTPSLKDPHKSWLLLDIFFYSTVQNLAVGFISYPSYISFETFRHSFCFLFLFLISVHCQLIILQISANTFTVYVKISINCSHYIKIDHAFVRSRAIGHLLFFSISKPCVGNAYVFCIAKCWYFLHTWLVSPILNPPWIPEIHKCFCHIFVKISHSTSSSQVQLVFHSPYVSS